MTRLLTIFLLFLILCNSPVPDPVLQSRLEKVRPYAKNGSCGYVAFYISRYLQARNVPHRIYVFGFGRWQNIHVMVRQGNLYIDKEGYRSALYWYQLMPLQEITTGQLEQMLHERWRWNKAFELKDTIYLQKIKDL